MMTNVAVVLCLLIVQGFARSTSKPEQLHLVADQLQDYGQDDQVLIDADECPTLEDQQVDRDVKADPIQDYPFPFEGDDDLMDYQEIRNLQEIEQLFGITANDQSENETEKSDDSRFEANGSEFLQQSNDSSKRQGKFQKYKKTKERKGKENEKNEKSENFKSKQDEKKFPSSSKGEKNEKRKNAEERKRNQDFHQPRSKRDKSEDDLKFAREDNNFKQFSKGDRESRRNSKHDSKDQKIKSEEKSKHFSQESFPVGESKQHRKKQKKIEGHLTTSNESEEGTEFSQRKAFNLGNHKDPSFAKNIRDEV